MGFCAFGGADDEAAVGASGFGAGEVGAVGFGSSGDGFAADPFEQGGAQAGDVAAGGGGVGVLEQGGESAGVGLVEDGRVGGGGGEQPLVGGLGAVVAFADFGADAGFGLQFLLGGDQVDQRGQYGPDPVEQLDLAGGVVAPVADGAAGDVPVLLLDVAAVVLVLRPGSGEGDLLLQAPGEQVLVDEFAAVVGVDPEQRERQCGLDLDQRGEHVPGGLVAHGADFGRPGGDVGDREGVGELAVGVAALMSDQVDFHESWGVLVPVGPGPHRDLRLQQRPGLGV